MVYDLTEKLRFDEDPVLVIGDTRLTVRSDAEVVLRLMDILRAQGEEDGAQKAVELLFTQADREKLSGLGLKLDDYIAVVRAAVRLALGEDPEADEPGE